MTEYIKLTPYIPDAEGYIQQENPEIFVRKDTIETNNYINCNTKELNEIIKLIKEQINEK